MARHDDPFHDNPFDSTSRPRPSADENNPFDIPSLRSNPVDVNNPYDLNLILPPSPADDLPRGSLGKVGNRSSSDQLGLYSDLYRGYDTPAGSSSRDAGSLGEGSGKFTPESWLTGPADKSANRSSENASPGSGDSSLNDLWKPKPREDSLPTDHLWEAKPRQGSFPTEDYIDAQHRGQLSPREADNVSNVANKRDVDEYIRKRNAERAEAAAARAQSDAQRAIDELGRWLEEQLQKVQDEVVRAVKLFCTSMLKEGMIQGTGTPLQREWKISEEGKLRIGATLTTNWNGEVIVAAAVTLSGTIKFPSIPQLLWAKPVLGLSGSVNTQIKWDLVSGDVTWSNVILTVTIRAGARWETPDYKDYVNAYAEIGIYATDSFNIETGDGKPGVGIYGRFVAEGRVFEYFGYQRKTAELRYGIGTGPTDTGN